MPYEWWTEADPRVSYVLRSATASYRHELLLDNISSIPLLEQHGGADDNVPVFHSRRMCQLISQKDPSPTVPRYVELAGQGHWLHGVMTTPQLRRFYQEVLDAFSAKEAPPPDFGMAVANPADMGSKNGVVIEQKGQPDQLGRVNVRTGVGMGNEMGIWEIETSNVARFHIDKASLGEFAPSCVVVDGDEVKLPSEQKRSDFSLFRSKDNTWVVCRGCHLLCHELIKTRVRTTKAGKA